MPGALLGQGSGALFWRASDFAKITREALRHHLEACFVEHFPQEGTGRGKPNPQEFITNTTQELQEARDIRGDHRLPGVPPRPGEDGGLRVCIDVPGLKRAISGEPLAFVRGALRGSATQLRSHGAGSTLKAASFPSHIGPSLRHVSLLLMSLVYLAGGAPRATSSPSRSGLT